MLKDRKKLVILAVLLVLIAVFVLVVRQAGAEENFNFYISLNPVSGSVKPGGILSSVINVRLLSGKRKRVSFVPETQPRGVKIKFRPSSCTPPCSSVMTIETSSLAEVGDSKARIIKIMGTGQGVTKTASYYLTVESLPSLLNIPMLFSPLNNAVVSTLTPFLDWSDVPGANFYSWAVGKESGVTVNSYLNVPTGILNYNTKYFWKVKACLDSTLESCSNFSEQKSFITPQNPEDIITRIRNQLANMMAVLLQLQKQLMELKAK